MIQIVVFVLATIDFWLVGWQVPSKEGMSLDMGALTAALLTGAIAIWAVLRVFDAKSRFALMAWLGIVLFISAVVRPVFESAREAASHEGCMSNLKYLVLSSIQYSSDYDDWLPPANKWRSLSEPYLRHSPVKGTSATPDPSMRCPASEAAWTYGFSAALSGLPPYNLAMPNETALVFDVESTNPNAAGGRKDFVMHHQGRGGIALFPGNVVMRKAADVRWER